MSAPVRHSSFHPSLPANRMAWGEFVDALRFSERHAYRLYRAPKVRSKWGRKLDMQFRDFGAGAVTKRLHLDRAAGEAEIERVRRRIGGGEDSRAY